MTDYISRESIGLTDFEIVLCQQDENKFKSVLAMLLDKIEKLPAADVCSVEAFKQVMWERDTALAQLAEIGKGLGAKMDDVRENKRGKWERTSYKSGYGYKCSECGATYNKRKSRLSFCPNCGADMRGAE